MKRILIAASALLLAVNALAGNLRVLKARTVTLTPDSMEQHDFTVSVVAEPIKMVVIHDETNTVPSHTFSVTVQSDSHNLTQFLPTMAYSPADKPEVLIHSHLPSMPKAEPNRLSFFLTVSPAARDGIKIVLRNRDGRKTHYRINLRDWKEATEQSTGE